MMTTIGLAVFNYNKDQKKSISWDRLFLVCLDMIRDHRINVIIKNK